MSAENCIDTTRCPCPCLPKVTLEQAVVDLVESIALQENALSHILCAESWSSSPTTCTIRLRMPQRSKKMRKGLSGCRAGLFSA